MRAGRLRDKVTIESLSSSTDVYGQPTDVWVEHKVRRCFIQPLNGNEYFNAQGENSEQTVRIRFRNEDNLLTKKMRIVDYRESPGKVYDVEEIINVDNRDREIIVRALYRG